MSEMALFLPTVRYETGVSEEQQFFMLLAHQDTLHAIQERCTFLELSNMDSSSLNEGFFSAFGDVFKSIAGFFKTIVRRIIDWMTGEKDTVETMQKAIVVAKDLVQRYNDMMAKKEKVFSFFRNIIAAIRSSKPVKLIVGLYEQSKALIQEFFNSAKAEDSKETTTVSKSFFESMKGSAMKASGEVESLKSEFESASKEVSKESSSVFRAIIGTVQRIFMTIGHAMMSICKPISTHGEPAK